MREITPYCLQQTKNIFKNFTVSIKIFLMLFLLGSFFIPAKLFAQVRMGDDFEEPGFRGKREALEVCRPDFIGVAIPPLGNFLRVVQVPRIRDVMHCADQIIPRVPRDQAADPIFMTGDKIHFHRQLDD